MSAIKGKNYQVTEAQIMTRKLENEIRTRLVEKYENLTIVWEETFIDYRFKQYGFSETNNQYSDKQKKELSANVFLLKRVREVV